MAHHWRKVCCPVDFSEPSWGALAEAGQLVAGGSGHLTILHVYDGAALVAAGDVLVRVPDVEEQVARETQRRLDRFRAEAERFAPGRVTAETLSGAPAAEIVRYAERNDVDLIVMATHGRTGLKRLVLGSVAERVVRQAPCSVLVVRPVRLGRDAD